MFERLESALKSNRVEEREAAAAPLLASYFDIWREGSQSHAHIGWTVS